MSEQIRHNCGLCVAYDLHDAYSFIRDLQHRGREATGIAAISDRRIDVIKWAGGVERFHIDDLHKIFPANINNYHVFMAHVRYATQGRKDIESVLQDAHPHVLGGTAKNRGNHIMVYGCEAAIVHNGQVNTEYLKDISNNVLKTDCDSEALLHLIIKNGEQDLIEKIPGAFTLAFTDRRKGGGIVVLRDKLGMRPGVLGWKDGKHCIASEKTALLKNGARFVKELEPGYAHYLSSNGSYWSQMVSQANPQHCFFEWNYLLDPESVFNRAHVTNVREFLGEELAEEFKPSDVDIVTFLPNCPEAAARAYANKLELPFKHVFYKMRKERSFQGSTQEERRSSIQQNLYLIPEIDGVPAGESLKDKVIVVVDDSTVRGTNSPRARYLLYEEAKIKKAYLANYTPPLGIIGEDNIPRGCLFGVDMAPGDSFIAINPSTEKNRTLEEISDTIGMDVVYLSQEGMFRAFERAGISRQNLCHYCIGGPHPFEQKSITDF